MLKPGAMMVDSAWVMTDLYDPNNPEHVKIKADIEVCLTLSFQVTELTIV